jgi:hypothetical protein
MGKGAAVAVGAVAVVGILGLAAWAAGRKPAPPPVAGCPPGSVAALPDGSCGAGYVADLSSGGCCVPAPPPPPPPPPSQVTCPVGEVAATPCPPGLTDDPNNPGCCYPTPAPGPTGCALCAEQGLPCDEVTGQCLQGPQPCRCSGSIPCQPAPPPPAVCPPGWVYVQGCCVYDQRYPPSRT